MIKIRFLALGCAFICSLAFAQNASERKFVREGNTEGSVLAKVGKPDSESIVSGAASKTVIKKWIYLPHPDDAQTITTITLRDGEVVDIKREVSR